MAAKKQISNSDIYKKLEAMDARISVLENKELAREIASNAVKEYKKDEQTEKDAKRRREIMKQVSYVLGLVILVIYVWLSSRGVHIL